MHIGQFGTKLGAKLKTIQMREPCPFKLLTQTSQLRRLERVYVVWEPTQMQYRLVGVGSK